MGKHINTDADQAIAEAEQQLEIILKHLRLTELEKTFVNDASIKLADLSWNLLMQVPEEKRMHMRPIITSVAISYLLRGAVL
jgi:hypothetical protein